VAAHTSAGSCSTSTTYLMLHGQWTLLLQRIMCMNQRPVCLQRLLQLRLRHGGEACFSRFDKGCHGQGSGRDVMGVLLREERELVLEHVDALRCLPPAAAALRRSDAGHRARVYAREGVVPLPRQHRPFLRRPATQRATGRPKQIFFSVVTARSHPSTTHNIPHREIGRVDLRDDLRQRVALLPSQRVGDPTQRRAPGRVRSVPSASRRAHHAHVKCILMAARRWSPGPCGVVTLGLDACEALKRSPSADARASTILSAHALCRGPSSCTATAPGA
jgi:hypothetical protein